MSGNRIPAAALAALGAASAIPIPLAQLDFAGLFNAFNIDNGDSPRALLVMAGVGGVLTFAVLGLAFAGAGLALTGAPAARTVLIAAALAGLVTAMPLWIPAGVVIGAAAMLLGQSSARGTESGTPGGSLLGTTGVDTRTPRQGEA
jgi:hypothetical protein